jgi:hypothetical protein
VACDVIAPSLVPVRTGDRLKADRRDGGTLCERGTDLAGECLD